MFFSMGFWVMDFQLDSRLIASINFFNAFPRKYIKSFIFSQKSWKVWVFPQNLIQNALEILRKNLLFPKIRTAQKEWCKQHRHPS